jgi:penicillin G amidase
MLRRALSLTGLVTAIAVTLLTFGAWIWTGRLVPPLDGQEQLAGLATPVQVAFDRYAIPHVYANSTNDMWAALGYLHGRERLWQMELYRRAAAGRLAEIFGERLLPLDRRFRRLGLRHAAAAELSRATPRVRAALERYAIGVNAAIRADGRWGLPVEFFALRVRPEDWDPVDTLAIGKLMAWRLGENHSGELVRYRLAGRFGWADVEQLMGSIPEWAPGIVEPQAARRLLSFSHGGPLQRRAVAAASHSRLPEGLQWLASGSRALSNSWVVAGSRTTTGRPLLANDPHLGVEMPAIWYEAHLVASDLDLAGVTIPGVPFIVIGHNQRIGWGVTNVGADVQDLYVERVDVKRRRYLKDGVWVPLQVERHQIVVRGRGPEPLEVLLTEHGPIASVEQWDDSSAPVDDAELSDRPLAFRWDVIMRGETSGSFEALGRAANWEEFLAAVRQLGSPAQNFVYADVDGNIGYAMAGLVPLRQSGDGSAPVDGPTNDHDWRGFLDPQMSPTVFNPGSGAIVTANNEVDKRFPVLITRDWVSPFRAVRVWQMLEGQNSLDMRAFQRMQGDRISAAADMILPAVDTAATAARRAKLDPSVLGALDRLRLWDRRVDNRPVVTLYEAFLAALWRRTFADEMGRPLFERFYEWAARERYAGLYMILGDSTSSWWDDVATTGKKEGRDDIVALAAQDAMLALNRRFGQESGWAWDRLHAVTFAHPLAAGGWPLTWVFSRGPIPIAGDGDTVNKTMVSLREPYATTEMASYRQILDVGAWDNSVSVITTGQSGHQRSPHYFDQNLLWRDGRYHPLPYSRKAVANAAVSHLLLVP